MDFQAIILFYGIVGTILFFGNMRNTEMILFLLAGARIPENPGESLNNRNCFCFFTVLLQYLNTALNYIHAALAFQDVESLTTDSRTVTVTVVKV